MLKCITDIINNELELDLTVVSENDKLSERGLDSITFMMLIVYLEEKFDIEFSFDGIFMQQFVEVSFGDLIKEIDTLIQIKEKAHD